MDLIHAVFPLHVGVPALLPLRSHILEFVRQLLMILSHLRDRRGPHLLPEIVIGKGKWPAYHLVELGLLLHRLLLVLLLVAPLLELIRDLVFQFIVVIRAGDPHRLTFEGELLLQADEQQVPHEEVEGEEHKRRYEMDPPLVPFVEQVTHVKGENICHQSIRLDLVLPLVVIRREK